MSGPIDGIRRWYRRWHALLPILVAEFIVVLGFGALLPILPFYVIEQGIDYQTLGIITAAWGMSKLVLEPVFGFVADHIARKPQMILGLVFLGVFTMLPLVFSSAFALFFLRLLSGASAAAYDPPARGIIVDATTDGERGEAFGLYNAAQMGGFLIGPVVGAVGASLGGGFAFPFILTGGLAFAAAIYLAIVLPSHVTHLADPTERAVAQAVEHPAAEPRAPLRALVNRLLIATVLMNLGFALSAGIYEVIWSLFMASLGASIEFIGLTFMLFGLPVLLLSTYAGRVVDRRGGLPFAVGGGLVIAACGIVYSLSWEPVFPAVLGLIEGAAFAFVGPALYSLLATASPKGRTATAQGIFGTSQQTGVVIGSVLAGYLWAQDHRWPFWFFFVVASVCALVGWMIARGAPQLRRTATIAATSAVVIALFVGCATPVPTSPPGSGPTSSPTPITAPTTVPTPTNAQTPSRAPTAEPTATAAASPGGTPSTTSQLYTIGPGDSLSSIAEQFGLTIEQLLAANPQITDPDHIEVGAVITIPPPDAPVGVPSADEILDPTGDLLDDADRPVFGPGYADLTELEARVDARTLYLEVLMVSAPPPTDPELEQIDYTVFVDTDADGDADAELRASNSLDPDQTWAGVVTDLDSGTTSSPADFPGVFSVESTVRFEVLRSALGPARRYGVAVMGVRRFFPAGPDDPDVEVAIDRIPEQAWPRVNAQWLEVGL